jgi:hypothetical protein
MSLADLPLFAARPTPPESGTESLERVSSRIGSAIVAFCTARVGQTFHADELRTAVTRACGVVAPGSADRVLRQLRLTNRIQYVVLSRRESLYRIDGVTR